MVLIVLHLFCYIFYRLSFIIIISSSSSSSSITIILVY